MKECLVKTKQELKKAVAEETDIIYIDPALEKDLKSLIRAMKLGPAKIAALVAFLTTTAAGIIAGVGLAIPTGGISAAISGITAMPGVIAFATTSGVSASSLAGLIVLCAVIGVGVIVYLLRWYDLEEEECTFNSVIGKIKFKRRYRPHKDKV